MTAPSHSQLVEADERLATVFSHFYCVQHDRQALPVPQQLLPNYEMLLAFNFGPPIPTELGTEQQLVRQTAVLGPLQRLLRYELPPGADLIVVNFTLNGFYRLLGVPMHRFTATEWKENDAILNSSGFDELWQQLATMTSLPDRLHRISEFALLHLSPDDEPDRLLLDTIPYFRETTVDPVKTVAEQHHTSVRNVQLRFQSQLGYSAKEMVRFLRFKKVLFQLMQQRPVAVDWLGMVLTFGYHDHSHLVKDFQYYLGVSPRQFIRQLAEGRVCISKSGKFY